MINIVRQVRLFSVSSVSLAVKQKIKVQLLKDFDGIGVKGQIVQVLPSKMINFLHPKNGACYILANQGPRIPVVKPEDIEKVKVSDKKPKPVAQVSKPKTEKPSLESVFKDLGLNLSIDSAVEAPTTSADSIMVHQAFSELPPNLVFNHKCSSDGRLVKAVTAEDLAKDLSKICGCEFKGEELLIDLIGNDELKSKTDIDVAGKYRVTLQLKGFNQLRQTIVVEGEM